MIEMTVMSEEEVEVGTTIRWEEIALQITADMILLIKETEETTQDREKETNPW